MKDSAGLNCFTHGCDGVMADVQPIEREKSDDFILIRIECPKCHARAWRIERPPEEGVLQNG